MGKEVDPTDAQVEDQEVPSSSTASGVQVDLKETPEKADAAGKAGQAPANERDVAAEERRLKALESQVAATRRINENLSRQLAEVTQRLQQSQVQAPEAGRTAMPEGTAQAVVDKYDALVADGKWQDAVRLLAKEVSQQEYRTARQIEHAEEQVQQVQARRLTTLEKQKQTVESLYPNLHRDTGDPDSPEMQLFNAAVAQLANEDSEFLASPFAPTLAMHRMEQLAASQGIKLSKATSQPNPTVRPGRGATSMPASRGAGGASGTTYQLSADQKEWCDANLGHLPEAERYKHYARFAKMSERGGIEA